MKRLKQKTKAKMVMIKRIMDKIVKVLKKIKLRNLIILIILLAFNSFAWFIYATRVSLDLTAHVSSWNVEFVSGSEEITTNIEIVLDRIYPGMENFEKTIEVHNKGETPAILTYEIQSLKIMDETFEVSEDTGLTSDELENKIETEYPFKIDINAGEQTMIEENEQGSFKIMVEWPFESGDDELDTYWGNKAYEYYSLNPGSQSIVLKLELIATQQN